MSPGEADRQQGLQLLRGSLLGRGARCQGRCLGAPRAGDTASAPVGDMCVNNFFCQALKDNEAAIQQEMIDIQGVSADVGGYYKLDEDKANAVMRPSKVTIIFDTEFVCFTTTVFRNSTS